MIVHIDVNYIVILLLTLGCFYLAFLCWLSIEQKQEFKKLKHEIATQYYEEYPIHSCRSPTNLDKAKWRRYWIVRHVDSDNAQRQYELYQQDSYDDDNPNWIKIL